MILTLLAGIAIAASVFATVLFAGFRAFGARGRLRLAYIGILVLSLAGMACISAGMVRLAAPIGLGLILTGAIALILEVWSRKIFAGIAMIFGLVLILGLPFPPA